MCTPFSRIQRAINEVYSVNHKINYTGTVQLEISLEEIFLLISPPALIGKIYYQPVLMIIHNVKVAGLGKFISYEYYNWGEPERAPH